MFNVCLYGLQDEVFASCCVCGLQGRVLCLFQVPAEYEDLYSDISDEDRRVKLAMVTHLDDGISRVIKALENNNMVDNTLLVFISDVNTVFLIETVILSLAMAATDPKHSQILTKIH